MRENADLLLTNIKTNSINAVSVGIALIFARKYNVFVFFKIYNKNEEIQGGLIMSLFDTLKRQAAQAARSAANQAGQNIVQGAKMWFRVWAIKHIR